MKCVNCGYDNANDAQFCINCGREIIEQKNYSVIICPTCGKENDWESVFCEKCGNRLGVAMPEQSQKSMKKRTGKWIYGVLGTVILLFASVMIFIMYREKQQDKKLLNQIVQGQESAQYEEDNNVERKAEHSKKKEAVSDESKIHQYSLFISDCGWNEAYQKAKDDGGYLVHINSNEEFTYLINQIERANYQKVQFYIGGRRDSKGTEYYWADGQNNLYGECLNTGMGDWFWMQNEPSFGDGDIEEAYLSIMYFNRGGKWVGNDCPENIVLNFSEFSGKTGYIVEYDS